MVFLKRAAHLLEASYLTGLLEAAGIPASVRRANLCALAGELPLDQCLPEIWLEHARDLDRARSLLADLQRGDLQQQPAWTCASCGEWLEGQFTACWQCGMQHPRGEHVLR